MDFRSQPEGWCHSHSAGPGLPPENRGPQCPGMPSLWWQKKFSSSSQQAVRRDFPETCSLRWSDKDNITCSLAGCRHGWAEWCKVGVSQCLDTVTYSKFWKHFKYKPFYSVKWPTWKLSGASKFAPFCGPSKRSPNTALVRRDSLAWKACEILERTHLSPVFCKALNLLF